MNWDKIKDAVISTIKTGAPIAAAAFPEAAFAINLATSLTENYERAEPSALALVNAIKSGQPVTNEQLEEYAQRYEVSYENLKHDIEERLHQLDEEEHSDDK